MVQVKRGYNACWTGKAYRHPAYTGDTDDRVQALAIISGIADAENLRQPGSVTLTPIRYWAITVSGPPLHAWLVVPPPKPLAPCSHPSYRVVFTESITIAL